MAERWRLCGEGDGFYEEKRSRFICRVWPVTDEEQAKARLAETRKKYPDARHHVWAWVLPDGSCRWSDDGEPGGTSGAPTAEVLKSSGVQGVMCVTTRYFGGTLLGSGGLVRAYSTAAKLAMEDAGREPDPEKYRLKLKVRWENLDRIHRLLREYGQLLDTDYASDPQAAVLEGEILLEDRETFTARFTDLTGGRGEIVGN